jgi:general secretion pathway protein D
MEYISDRVGINILYDQNLADRRVTILSPRPVAEEDLVGVLNAALRISDLALTPLDVPAWLQVTATDPAQRVPTQQPIRFYKLKNSTAADVLETLRTIRGQQRSTAFELQAGEVPSANPYGEALPPSESISPQQSPAERQRLGSPLRNTLSPGGPESQYGPSTTLPPQPAMSSSAMQRAQRQEAPRVLAAFESEGARVMADANTNQIIVIGPEPVQQTYQTLIEALDQRRPQVLIETTIVSLDTSRNFRFGVEIAGGDRSGNNRLFSFTQFGLSEVDPDTGRLTLSPGIGLNGALITSDIADVIIQALKSTTRATVSSAPRLLVNDNATGLLTSTRQEPFESINASDTIATTSFGGFVEAGTTISLTPHISEDDYLQLEYEVELSAFAGDRVQTDAGTVLPPARQQNSLASQVTVPDGYTIIAGGLNRSDTSEVIDRVPILGEIPGLEYLFSSRDQKQANTTLFVFIRPIILRHDRFADLKYLSDRDLAQVTDHGNFPASEPMLVRW